MNFIITAIVNGSEILVPCLFVLHLLKIKFGPLKWQVLVQAVNMAVLIGALLYAGNLLMEFFIGWYSGTEYEQYTFINRLGGPYWYVAAVVLFGHFLMPQIFWFKRWRKSIVASMVVALTGLIIPFMDWLVRWLNLQHSYAYFIPDFRWSVFLVQAAVYLLILTVCYLVIDLKTKDNKVTV